MRFPRYLAVAAIGVSLAACDLEVTNLNNPDRDRILASSADVEALASSQFQQIVNATHGNFNSASGQMATASFMNTSSLANAGMGPRSAIPRGQIDNAVGNNFTTENFREYRILSGVARNGADILIAMQGDEFALPSAAAENRLKAVTHFVYGLSYGYISLAYDSSGIARPTDEQGFQPPLEGYEEVNAFALEQMDSALAVAGRGMSDVPGDWLAGPGAPTISVDEFMRIVHSYSAQLRASVARNPTERAAVDWGAVVADAQNGIQEDFVVQMDPNSGWDYNWLDSQLHFRDANWHQMNYYIIGMADTSGEYGNWLATDRDSRQYFVIQTPDERFPDGATRDDQTRPAADDDDPLPEGQYFRNRNPGKDEGSSGWRASMYDHYRFKAFADADGIGPFPLLTKAEIDMLEAEGHIRNSNPGAAVPLINEYRVDAGLEPVTASGVPASPECVPMVPQGTSGSDTACGNLMHAMMWEKWMETAFTSYGAWFFDNRGWGILPEGTAIHWPVPNQELDARQLPIYSLGGAGNPGASVPSIFGFGGSR